MKSPEMSAFSSNLRSLMKTNHLTQKQLAEDLHVGASTVYFWLSDRVKPTDENLQRLADYFNVSPIDLMPDADTKASQMNLSTAVHIITDKESEDKLTERDKKRKILFDKTAKATSEEMRDILFYAKLLSGDNDE